MKKRPQVLVVDDDTPSVRVIEVLLRKTGYRVATASNARDAITIATTQPVDLAILDILLPDLDGFGLCQHIRALTDAAVMFLTARSDPATREKGLAAGADAYLTKPFPMADLLVRIEELISGKQGGSQTVTNVRNVPATTEISLSQRRYALWNRLANKAPSAIAETRSSTTKITSEYIDILPRIAPRRWRPLVPSLSLPAWDHSLVVALSYLVFLSVAELTTAFISPLPGLALHFTILVALFVQMALDRNDSVQSLLLVLTLGPLIRILNLTLPLETFSAIQSYAIVSVPLFGAVYVLVCNLKFSWRSIGFLPGYVPLQLAIGLTGVVFGYLEYHILDLPIMVDEFSLARLWVPALILFVTTGFLEELIFRGIMQKVATQTLHYWGIPFVALLFAMFHIGYGSFWAFVFVLITGFFFGWIVEKTESLLGVTIAHGLTNIVLFLVMPFV